ncbi:MAG: DUF4956 domain-containing protein [Ilumatobacter sp.]|uniref:DUF4956 domain-containing protein n=1 Tax=Ilumatobacter sp. TaxID=1967498 RepID=UPI002626B8F7|nr:DUF4956 domain-containing protein [Ilumatobacter sp.]MDJ0767558.1 DUF4956 domain-containing protein [Ilumatobacter sp.]
MSNHTVIALNVVAVAALAFGLYFPRYHRKDMVVAILGLNVGVMGVATALASSEVSAGLGLGLFGVLSIIRLRSNELAQEEVAYYFSALALGLLAGFDVDPAWLTPTLMGGILIALFVGDHPRLFPQHRHQNVQLDSAYTDEARLVARLGELLDADIVKIKIKRVDLVNDTTTVDVRYRLRTGPVETSMRDLDRAARTP